MADIGRVKMAVPGGVRRGSVGRLRALVIHPHERVERQGGRSVDRNYRFVNRVVVTYLGRELAVIEPSTSVSENPTFTIPFRATETGLLKVTFFDTHGGKFEGTAEVKVT
ncbi:MAG TPA: thiosulfate oxidation carrier complex protein SoxZ [Methylomirabilota bacterium]|nr:thiosulfate oxidation carrier complex protein SoxZ [Methylomirabilota bacterium]